jgi:prepilin-type N-terminal cleavage/methylation domain-containing protein
MPSRPNPRHAFTLAELLTVIGIIAILAGLLFPAIGMVKKQAKKAKATSIVQQVGAAIETYRTMNGVYPEKLRVPIASSPEEPAWLAALAKANAVIEPDITPPAAGDEIFLHVLTDRATRPTPKSASAVGNPNEANDPAWSLVNFALTQLLLTSDSGIAPRGLLLDPWDHPLRYRPNRYYPFDSGKSPTVPTERIDSVEPPNPDGFQLWSIGNDEIDQQGEGGDDIPNWVKLPLP